jgi:hypothetical protein
MTQIDLLGVEEVQVTLEESGDYAWVRMVVDDGVGGRVCVVFHPKINPTASGFAADKESIKKLREFFGLGDVGVARAA